MSLFSSKELSTGWEFKAADDQSPETWLPVAKVPTVVHLDLMANDKIPDTSCDTNELEAQWVDQKRWSYRCQFGSPPGAQQGNRVRLVFEGLDTFAKVLLNDRVILESDNMFIAYTVDITGHLRSSGPNTLQIDFDSALLRGRAIQDANIEHRYLCTLGSPERLAVRKAQYHWGWDWGPVFATAGPWRPVRLETYRSRIDDIWIEYSLSDDLRSCQGTIHARVDGHASDKVRFALRTSDGEVVCEAVCEVDIAGLAKTAFLLREVSLWYPHGYGDQYRYSLDAELITGGVAVHLMTKNISFRRAELIQETDSHGKSFYFRVNGVDIFAGGSCWIPADNFIPRLSVDKYRNWLTLMIEGNQIMVRVWGGGIYEEDIFYDVCDELGILVWQDFMFACGSYPTFPSFLDSIEREARYNVRRLHHHPSIIMYAGGNENFYIQELHGLTYDYAGDKDPQSWLRSTFPSRYIFEHLLPKVVAEEAPSVVYHPDSPWGDGKNIMDPTVGDIHQWEVWHANMRPYQDYGQIGGRFNSEFGMQAFPHISTINQFITKPSGKYPQSSTMDFHNKCRSHERRLALYVRENFRASNSDLKNWVYLTQLLQSEAMHYAYRSWRRQWAEPSARRCGGALVWQLNDCWPVTSWAVVDYFLVKKPAFYTIKRALSPLTVAVLRTHDSWTGGHDSPSSSCEYDVWISSNGNRTVTNLIADNKGSMVVELRFISIRTGIDSLPPQQLQVTAVLPNGTTVVQEKIKLINPPIEDDFVISAKLLVGGIVVSQDIDWPQPYKYLSFADRGLQVRLAAARTKIIVTASRPTKGLTFAERPGLRLSDNGFDVLPGQDYVVDVEGLEEHEELEWVYLGIDESRGTLRANL